MKLYHKIALTSEINERIIVGEINEHGGETMAFKKARLKVGMTQADVAKKLKIDRSTVAKWEAGEALPNASKLPMLAKLYKCSIDILLKSR